MKYIDADKLIANLERQNVDKKVIEPLIRIITSLQQEQQTVNDMTQEERELVLKEICSRIYYWPTIVTEDGDVGYVYGVDNTNEGVFNVHILEDVDDYDTELKVEQFKLLLRPMSSMTEEEAEEYETLVGRDENVAEYIFVDRHESNQDCLCGYVDWLKEHDFDYSGLIGKGLAEEKRQDWLR